MGRTGGPRPIVDKFTSLKLGPRPLPLPLPAPGLTHVLPNDKLELSELGPVHVICNKILIHRVNKNYITSIFKKNQDNCMLTH